MATDRTALLAKLSSLRNDIGIELRSTNRTPTQLRTFLLIYTRTVKDSYTNYMEGAKALYEWLSPIQWPDYPAIDDNYKLPRYCESYELEELAKILVGYRSHKQLPELARAKRAIYITTFKEVIPELY